MEISQRVAPKQRQGCPGTFGGISPQQCAELGCCFNSTTPNIPWCFTRPSPVERNVTITNRELKWLGFFGQPDPSGSSYDPIAQSTFANFGASSDFGILAAGSEHGMSGLFRTQLHLIDGGVGSNLGMRTHMGQFLGNWTGKKLFPDYRKRWSKLALLLQPWVANGTIKGFHIGDELCWGGLPYADFVAMATLVANTNWEPRPPEPLVIYSNGEHFIHTKKSSTFFGFTSISTSLMRAVCISEAAGPIVHNVDCFGNVVNYSAVPDAVTWISFDFYNPPASYVKKVGGKN